MVLLIGLKCLLGKGIRYYSRWPKPNFLAFKRDPRTLILVVSSGMYCIAAYSKRAKTCYDLPCASYDLPLSSECSLVSEDRGPLRLR